MINLVAVGHLIDKYELPNLDCVLIIQMVFRQDFRGIDNYLRRNNTNLQVYDNIRALIDRNILKSIDKSVKSINFMDLYLEESFVETELVSDLVVMSSVGHLASNIVNKSLLSFVGNSRYNLENLLNNGV